MKLRFLLLASVILLLAGCVIVRPSDKELIQSHAANAAAMSEKVQADAACPDYAKTWWKAEAKTWAALADWAAGRKPTEGGQ
jgi:hypothetical protein